MSPTRRPSASSAVDGPQDARWTRLREIVDRHSLLRGDFVLSSGGRSTYLFQLRQTTMLPEGQALIGHLVVEAMRSLDLRCVGGLALGAVPIVTAAAFASHLVQWPVHAFFVRKEAKKHGAREQIDGHCPEGANVLIVDDVATTGNSILEAVDHVVAERRCRVAHALCIVDREEGASEALAARGIALHAVFRRRDFAL